MLNKSLAQTQPNICIQISADGNVDIQTKSLQSVSAENESRQYFSVDAIDQNEWIAEDISTFARKNKGVALVLSQDSLDIYNDIFGTIPLYVARRGNGCLFITSNFEDILSLGEEFSRDLTGIYEVLLYEGCIYDRTIFQEVKQLPVACTLHVDLRNLKYSIQSYWNFCIQEDSAINTMEKAVEKAYGCLQEIFSAYQDRPVIMGLSGGLDSRMSACLLSKYVSKEDLQTYTFGYDKHILEYRIACKVAKQLGINIPAFKKLDKSDYMNSFCLPAQTACHVGINHSHMLNCIKKLNLNGEAAFLSNYYSDAVMGWSAEKDKKNETVYDSSYYKKAMKFTLFGDGENKIKEQITADLLNVGSRYSADSNFSGIDEFIYVTERNPKFHVRLSYACSELRKIDLPYANYKLLTLMLSIPLTFRYQKQIEQKIIETYFMKTKDISSGRYFEYRKSGVLQEDLYYNIGRYCMRGLNLANVILAKISNSNFQVINPYLTENQNIILNRDLYACFEDSLGYLVELGVFGREAFSQLEKREERSGNSSLKYTIMGLADCLRKTKSRASCTINRKP